MSKELKLIKTIGKLINDYLGNNTKSHDSIYNDQGITEPNEHYGVQFKVVNEWLDNIIKFGTKMEADTAKAQARNFVYLTPGISYPQDIYDQIFANQGRLVMVAKLLPYYKMSGAWEHVGNKDVNPTGEIIFDFPPMDEYMEGEWEEPQSRLISRIEGHAVVGNNNYSNVKSRHWKTRFFDLIFKFAKDKYYSDLRLSGSLAVKPIND